MRAGIAYHPLQIQITAEVSNPDPGVPRPCFGVSPAHNTSLHPLRMVKAWFSHLVMSTLVQPSRYWMEIYSRPKTAAASLSTLIDVLRIYLSLYTKLCFYLQPHDFLLSEAFPLLHQSARRQTAAAQVVFNSSTQRFFILFMHSKTLGQIFTVISVQVTSQCRNLGI